MAYRDEFVDLDSVRLHYLDWGGEGPAVLFLHPTGFHAHIWEPFARRLSPRYRCIALDARGHGDSDKPGSYYWSDFAGDLQSFLRRLQLQQITGIGHSAGGSAIITVAAREPAAFNRAVLMDPILLLEDRPPDGSEGLLIASARRRRMVWRSRAEMFDSFVSKPPFNSWDRELLHLYVDYGVRDLPDGTVELKCPGDVEAEMYRWGPSPPHIERLLPEVSCPVLLVGGSNSEAFPADVMRRAAMLLPNAAALTVDGASHFVPFERPRETQAAIDGFLAVP